MRETTVRSAEVPIAVADHGGDGTPVLLLHGLGSNLRIWDPVASRLANDFRVVAMDARTHGRSGDGEDLSFDALTGDVEAVASELALDRPVVVGHSWGASVALHHAVSKDARGVVCVDGGLVDMQGMGASWEQTEELLRPPVLEGPADELLARIRGEQDVLPWDDHEPVVRRSFVVDDDGIMRRRTPIPEHMRIVRHLWEQRPLELYGRLGCPAMVVLAAGIERAPREQGFVAAKQAAAERLAAEHPDVRVEWLESVHDVPIHAPDELAALIGDFVRTA